MGFYVQYSDRERKFIIDNYLRLSDAEIAIKLNRTRIAVGQERCRLRIFRPNIRVVNGIFNKAIDEAIRLRAEWHLVQDMKALIIICQLEKNTYKREKYKQELKKLSGIK